MTMTAGFGNTFFIGLFGNHLRDAFTISHGEFGLVFMAASVACGLSLPIVGKYIDHVELAVYAMFACTVLAAGALLLSFSENVFVLLAALFLIRLGGPGMLNHAAVTSMGQYFAAFRGRAVSISLLGQPLSEAILPAFAVMSIALIGWHTTWVITAGTVLLVCLPAATWLARERPNNDHHARPTADGHEPRLLSDKPWTRAQVLKDWRFYIVILSLIWSTGTISGLFFHQALIAEIKNWSLAWVASCFIGFAIAKVIAIITTGSLIDRYGSFRILPLFLLPMGFGLLSLASFEAPLMALLYFAGAGLSAGAGFTLHGTIWAELYGIDNLGAVRSVARSITFPAGALAPAGFGILFDWGVTLSMIAVVVAGSIFATCALIVATNIKQALPD